MPTVVLPRSLADLFPGMPRRVDVAAGSVGSVIGELDARWPGVRDRLCEPGPVLREYINVYVNGEPARIDTALPEGSTVHILPAVAGG